MKRIGSLLSLCLVALACDPRLPIEPDLDVDFESIDAPTTPLSEQAKLLMNGVYEVVRGNGLVGNPVVCKWVGNRLCLYAQHDVVYVVLAGGSSGDSIKLRGYLRTVRSGGGTRLRLGIARNDGAADLIAGIHPESIKVIGASEDGQNLELRRLRDIAPPMVETLAHRGGARNSDRLGISENSVPMIRYASLLGATGIEVDVKRTRDGRLILFHDNTFSPRTVQGIYLLGPVENFDLGQITSLGRLIHGEPIPTLTEALTAVIDETALTLVWLDIKDPLTVPAVVRIQQEMLVYATAKGRDSLRILLGIPTQEVLDAYTPFRDSADALVELDVETALSLPRCRVWAPAWTRDITPADVAAVRAAQKRVFTWTVDLRESIVEYMERIDGILTNYPTLVTGIQDSRNGGP